MKSKKIPPWEEEHQVGEVWDLAAESLSCISFYPGPQDLYSQSCSQHDRAQNRIVGLMYKEALQANVFIK